MESAASALCMEPGQRLQVRRVTAQLRVVRCHCEPTRLPTYRCSGKQQANGRYASFAECALDGCVKLHSERHARSQQLTACVARNVREAWSRCACNLADTGVWDGTQPVSCVLDRCSEPR